MAQSTDKIIVVVDCPKGINKRLERLIRDFKHGLDSAGIASEVYDPGRQFLKNSALKELLGRLIRKTGIPKEIYVDNGREPVACHSGEKAGEPGVSDVELPGPETSTADQVSSYYPYETLAINEKGVFLNGQEIHKCTRVDIAKIGTGDYPEVVLHMDMNEIDVKWTVK